MHRPVCVKCQTELRCEKNEVVILDMIGPDEEVYKGWYADMFKCPGCGVQIVVGFAQEPFTESFHPDHESRLGLLKKAMQSEYIIRNFKNAKVPA